MLRVRRNALLGRPSDPSVEIGDRAGGSRVWEIVAPFRYCGSSRRADESREEKNTIMHHGSLKG